MIRQLYITGRTRVIATFSAALVCAALPAGAVVFGQTAAAVSGQNVISPQPAAAPAPTAAVHYIYKRFGETAEFTIYQLLFSLLIFPRMRRIRGGVF